MAAKKSTGRSAKTGAVTGRAKTSKAGTKAGAKIGGKVAKKSAHVRVAGGKVPKGGIKRVVDTTGPARVVPVVVERVLLEKVPVTGRLVKLGTIDRSGARQLDEVITGATEITLTSGSGKTTTVTGALLGVIRTVAAALEHGESVTVLGDHPEAALAGAVISSQEAADLLNVSRPFVVKLAKSGQLPHLMVGNRHRFALADVLDYAEQMRTERSAALAAIVPDDRYAAGDF